MNNVKLAIIIGITIFMAGCATGPQYSVMVSSIPPLEVKQGRIYFYRSGFLGAAIRPNVRLNEVVVGEAIAGGFFFVDRDPGKFVVALSTEVERNLSFTLESGQTRYVKLTPSFGVIVGRVYPELKGEDEAMKAIRKLKYIGKEL